MKRIGTHFSPLAVVMLCPLVALAGPVDINSADAATIAAELQGVGMVKAEAIVEYREAHGPFRSADDLVLVKGIATRTIELNRDDILLEPPKEMARD